jgi:hypothetical protein
MTTELIRDQLAEHEAVIERGIGTFIEVGNALMAIRDGRLYRETGYASFDAYCRERWGMGRSHAYHLIDASEVAAVLSTNVHTVSSEGQARELVPLRDDPETLRQVWEESIERAAGQPTAQVIREVREEVKFSQIEKPKNIGTDKTKVAVSQRNARIEEMAREGYHPDAIASVVGIDEETVRRKIHEAGLETVQDRIGTSRRVDVNRVMESVVDSAAPSEHAIALINADWKDLDRERFPEWRSSLRQAVNTLRRMVERIEKETK